MTIAQPNPEIRPTGAEVEEFADPLPDAEVVATEQDQDQSTEPGDEEARSTAT